MKWIWWLLISIFVLVGVVLFGVTHDQLGLTNYVRAWVYTKIHPEARVMLRAEKTPLSITGIYIDHRDGVIRLWRDWRVVSYQLGEEMDYFVIRGCDTPNYDESKMQRTITQSKEEMSSLAKKGDFVVVVLDSLETKNPVRVLISDYWPFVVDKRLEVQCHARNL